MTSLAFVSSDTVELVLSPEYPFRANSFCQLLLPQPQTSCFGSWLPILVWLSSIEYSRGLQLLPGMSADPRPQLPLH